MTKRLLILAALIGAIFLFGGIRSGWTQDIGVCVVGTPTTDAAVTSNTARLYGFWTRKPRRSDVPTSWTVTKTQWFADHTSAVLYRNLLREWLYVENRTTYTLYLAVNVGLSAANRKLYEAPATVDTTAFQAVLTGPSTTTPSRMTILALEEPLAFPIYNVGIYAQAPLTEETVEITSTSVVIRGR